MMRMLAGHPCAVQLHEVFEDDSCFYLVSQPASLLVCYHFAKAAHTGCAGALVKLCACASCSWQCANGEAPWLTCRQQFADGDGSCAHC
jgi:hypothetical protein